MLTEREFNETMTAGEKSDGTMKSKIRKNKMKKHYSINILEKEAFERIIRNGKGEQENEEEEEEKR